MDLIFFANIFGYQTNSTFLSSLLQVSDIVYVTAMAKKKVKLVLDNECFLNTKFYFYRLFSVTK